MTRWGKVLLAVLGAFLALAGAASGGVVAESNSRDGNRTLLQRFYVIGRAIDYNVVADDPDGLYPLCMTMRLERRTPKGWRPVSRTRKGFHRECLASPSEAESTSDTHVGWDTFIYPTRQLFKKFKRGELRIHGSTNLGGDLTYRR